jgi:hypothetical protein
MKKPETVQEYLARGGKINKIKTGHTGIERKRSPVPPFAINPEKKREGK